ncbi:MAG: TatD family hydrolase [Chloroflexi bacterium]|nr:TatD family hydrolase [Chloroflexota bacterium]
MFIDIHTHVDQYEREDLDGLLERARVARVGCIVAAGTTIASSEKCVELSRIHRSILAGVGVHPQDLPGELGQSDLDSIDRLAADPGVVAMSEVGLDFQADSPDRALQERALRSQLEIARAHRLPVVFHMRESTADTLRVLRDARVGGLGGAAHYFQGSWEEAKSVIDLGFKVSLARPLLRLPDLQDVARRLPLSGIVLETDSYPQYFKSKRERWTEPRDVPVIAARLAELKEVAVDEVEAQTTSNALVMFGPRAGAVRRAISGEREA